TLLGRVEAARRDGGRVLVQYALHHLAEIALLAAQGYAATQPRARQVEHVVYHAPHAPAAFRHPYRRLPHDVFLRDPLEQIRRVEDGAERIAQIVTEHRGEQLVEAQRLRQFLELTGELPFL